MCYNSTCMFLTSVKKGGLGKTLQLKGVDIIAVFRATRFSRGVRMSI